jgi:Yip1 domain
MSDFEVRPAAEAAPGLTQWERVSDTFFAPSKTFADIKRGNRSWWLPFLITIAFSYLLFAGVTMKVGWQQVAQNNLAMNAKQSERMSSLSQDQRDRAMKMIGVVTEISVAASPVLILIFAALVSLILWGTINFGFGGKSTYGEVFAVNMYATLPFIIRSVLGTAALFAGMAPDSFNIQNAAATNPAYFLSIQDTNHALYALLSQVDILAIWVAILLSMGIAKVAGKSKSAGFITVFGWWVLVILIRVGIAAVTG